MGHILLLISGLVGRSFQSALNKKSETIKCPSRYDLDLIDQTAVSVLKKLQPEKVILAAARVGGIGQFPASCRVYL